MIDARDGLIAHVRSRLIGPRSGPHEKIEGSPQLQYMMGMLYAQGVDPEKVTDQLAAVAEQPSVDARKASEEDGGANDWIGISGEMLPAAVGLSFVLRAGETIACDVAAARYEEERTTETGRKRVSRSDKLWVRVPLDTGRSGAVELTEQTTAAVLWDGRARLESRWRAHGADRLVTVSLVNAQFQEGGQSTVETILFQVELRCRVKLAEILPYPAVARPDDEEAFLYRASVPFARGHGTAASWERDAAGKCIAVSADYMPTVDVPLATFDLPLDGEPQDADVLSVQWLATERSTSDELISALTSFVDSYESWIEAEMRAAEARNEHAARPLVKKARLWALRMRKGIALIRSKPDAQRVFAVANRAMGSQMILTSFLKRLDRDGESVNDKTVPSIDDFSGRTWRPFQLAFFLGVIEGLWDEKSPDRDIADVIWFPTGGGKTEAYLLVAAFELLRRRISNGIRETATAIFSRYTLRMLTAQQFQRTAALFAALEEIRRSDTKTWGMQPFRLGLWVGDGLTPNKFTDAEERLATFQDDSGAMARNPFLLSRCPRCGHDLFGRNQTRWGIVATPSEFRLFCTNANCPLREALPVDIVDQSLYKQPPSMIIGTVDKFAMLAWDERAKSFFCGPDGGGAPPSLFIQDELHLISGPLGTLDAGYEGALESVIMSHGGSRPKIICSTATIKNAAEQVRGLYARDAFVFPTPVRSWDSAYFFGSDPSRTRRYVGLMGQGVVLPLISLIWTAASILQAVNEVPMDEKALNGFWTLIAYHNSRRELGRTLTAARDEIPARMKVVAKAGDMVRDLAEVMELSAQMTIPLTEAIGRLELSHGGSDPALDLVPSTSIMSVGVDIDRLALMLVNGQPKLTAEYIQATSRVGRGETQGLVFSLFSSMKSRDRSHYEDFRSFHENLYRYVEPTSVTPFAPPARLRTLHAALVAAVRHGTQWGANNGAASIDLDSVEVARIRHQLIERARAIEPELVDDVERDLDSIIAHWKEHQQSTLLYSNAQTGTQFDTLLVPYGTGLKGGYQTMRSMRHVDGEIEVRIVSGGVK